MSGRWWRAAARPSRPFAASTVAQPCTSRVERRKRRIAGSSSTISTVTGALGKRRLRQRLQLERAWKDDAEHAAGPADARQHRDRAAHDLDEPLADGEPEAGAALAVPGLLAAVELVEHQLRLVGIDSRPLVGDLEHHPARLVAGGHLDDGVARRVTGSV